MITRYVPLGLLCILLFLGCTTIVIEEKVQSRDIVSEINQLIDQYRHQPATLIDKITALLEPGDLSYNPLLARLELSLGRFNESINRIEAIENFTERIDDINIIIIAKMSLGIPYSTEINYVLLIDPLNTFVNNIIAEDFIRAEDLNAAQAILNELITNNRANGKTYILLGDLTLEQVKQLNLGRKKVLNSREEKQVVALYERSLNYYLQSEDQNTASYYVKLSNVYRKLGNKLDAVKALTKAIELDPLDSWNYFDRGKLYFYMNSSDRALKDFKEAYRLNPDHFFSNVFLGRLYFSLDNSEKALEHYNIAISINPDYTPAYKDLSVLYYMEGDIDRSLDYLVTLYKSKTDKDPLLSLYLVNSLIEGGRTVEAKKILGNLVKYEKNSTMKGIYYYFLDPDRAGDQALNDALLFEDQYQRMRLTYYVSCALQRGGIYSLSQALFLEVAESKIDLESKLAKYKLGVTNE